MFKLILTIILLLQLSEVCSVASPIRLPLGTGNFVKVLVGYPGVYLNLQINTSSNDVEIYTPLHQHKSQSATLRRDGWGEDVFYLNGDTGVWLPYHLNTLPVKDSFQFYPPGDGSLGLGRHSPIFRFWHNYTLNSQYLYLGYFDQFSQLSYNERSPVLAIEETSPCQLSDGSVCEVILDSGRMDTYLPVSLYEKAPHHLTLLSHNCQRQYHEIGMVVSNCEDEETFQLSDNSLKLLNGLEYNATKRHEGHEIRLGMHFLKEYSLFQDRVFGKQFFTQSAFSIRPAGHTAICIVMLAFILMTWATIVAKDTYGSEWTLNLTFMLEFYGYLVCVVAWAGAVFGLLWHRLVANFLRMSAIPLLVCLSLILFACLIGSLWVVSHFELQITLKPRVGRIDRNRAAARRLKQLRILFFPSAVFLTLWLCVLQNHNALADIVYLLAFVTALCINASVLACAAYVYSLPYRWVFYVALVPLYVFMWFTLIPTFNVVDLHYSTLLESVGYTIFLVMMPSLIMFMKYATERRSVKKVKKKAVE